MVFRVLAGFLAFWFTLGFFAGLYHREFILAGSGLLLGGLFLIYAIGGNKLIKRISSIL